MRIWAIRIGEAVEFRASNKPPRALLSRWKHYRMVKEYQYSLTTDYRMIAKEVEVKRQIQLQQVFFFGGRVLGFCSGARFRKFAREQKVKAILISTKAVEIPASLKAACLTEKV